MILNRTNGFAVAIEAKLLSDISCDTTYSMTRNQMTRIMDVMLASNDKLGKLPHEPLNRIEPEKSLFLLVTPKEFKENPRTRFYGYKYLDYKNNLEAIDKELDHRELNSEQLKDLSSRIGWITWEKLRDINRNCCKWLPEK